MSGAIRWACAAALGLALAVAVGCKVTDFSLLAVFQGTNGNDRVVAGSMDTVAASLHAQLSQLGLAAFVTPEGEAVRIRSSTKTGQHFSLILTRVQSGGLEQTKVHFEWEGKPDEQTEVQLLGAVEVKRTAP